MRSFKSISALMFSAALVASTSVMAHTTAPSGTGGSHSNTSGVHGGGNTSGAHGGGNTSGAHGGGNTSGTHGNGNTSGATGKGGNSH